jgi:hypothetical protein
MSLNTWTETLLAHRGDGTALTAAAAASLLQGATATRALYTFPANFFEVNKVIKVHASGRVSTLITTPGTFRFDIRLGGVVAWDSLAINPATAAGRTNVHWYLEVELYCQAAGSGTTAALFPGKCTLTTDDLIAGAIATAGPVGMATLPYNTAPAVGTGFSSVVSQQMDLFFTQTVATGSITLHTLRIEALN